MLLKIKTKRIKIKSHKKKFLATHFANIYRESYVELKEGERKKKKERMVSRSQTKDPT